MLNSRQRLGQSGEKLAANYLKKQGYKLIEINYRSKLGEIDIVAKDRGTLVFIEVKTRSGEQYGSPAAAVTPTKQRQISRAAQCYLAEHQLFDTEARFDVVSVLRKGNDYSIKLIRDAFELCE